MKSLKGIVNILLFVLVLVVALACLLLLLHLLPLILFFSRIGNKKSEQEYREFMLSIEGGNFMCYTNKKKSRAFIEREIIPILPEGTSILFLEGKQLHSDFGVKLNYRFLYQVRYGNDFPTLIKIRNSEMIRRSINNEVYNVMNNGKQINRLSDTIDDFFQ